MPLKQHNPALILIDLQKAFDNEAYWGGNRNNKNAEDNCVAILEKWRALQLPIFHIVHSSQNPESLLYESNVGFEIKDQLKPLASEPVIKKSVNSAFIGTDLKARLDKQNISHIVIVGLTTNHCVSTTTRMAGNYGYETYLISDATATFDRIGINGEHFDAELIHQTTLANLNNEFATVIKTEVLLDIL
ncbi:nicotinamidase-related amidase [Bisgaardia hudsonensis]|uniref:Nicotinamidase-related amidase n=1 Tax=Bisgaardia hudsonensis TaxID=109472 RepID=A0A4R2N2Z7_9PAST|nr:cysteine hydrolase family protein [Bisgaardia hudsonensis]QLB12725.1 isochorismatase [Bisgaardia hudsonensis]TCP14276.1 nicotinamidase-related amidase [Bisgaardia hudsonensis]